MPAEVVLRGVSQGEDGTVLKGWGRHDSKAEQDIGLLSRYSNMIIIKGSGGLEEVPGTTRKIVDDYVSAGTLTFRVESSDGLHIGDTVIVRRYGNREWIRETGMYTSKTDWNKVKQIRSDSDRVITVIDGNRVTVDAPIVNPIETRWGGGELIISHDPGRINNVGIENLRGISLFDESVRETTYYQTKLTGPEYYADENHYWNFIMIDNAINFWARNITAVHFVHSCVLLGVMTKWATVQDCNCLDHVSLIIGARRALYVITGQLCLVQRCTSDTGRHDFVLGGNPGPNVFLDCSSGRSY